MKKILAILLTGVLFLSVGCSNPATPTNTMEGGDNQLSPPDSSRENSPNQVMGKIVNVSETEIIVEIGTLNRPQGAPDESDIPPARDTSQPNGDQPLPRQFNDGSIPPGEPPVARENQGGEDPGSRVSLDLEYTGEEASYAIADSVTVTKEMGANSETLTVSDLAAGDVVRLELDENNQLVAIQLFQPND